MSRQSALAPSRYAGITDGVVIWFGLVGTAVYVVTFTILMQRGSYAAWSTMLLVPFLIAITLPMLWRQSQREEDRPLFRLLTLALLVKLAGAVARYYVAFTVYGGVADAGVYDKAGLQYYQQFRHGVFQTDLPNLVSTNFLKFVTGIVYAVIGPNLLGGFLVFSWLGFLGLFLFYRAFVIAVPSGSRRSYAHLLFFLPSMVFWPSSIGKESWMMFALGVAAFGAARLLTGRTVQGLASAGLGLWLTYMVRPHMAGLLGVTLAFAFLFRPSRASLRELAPVIRIGGLIVVLAGAALLISRTDAFLKEAGVNTSGGLDSTLTQLQSRTAEGGSQFNGSAALSPSRLPVAAFTVLFRPLITEAGNAQTLLAALEANLLFLLVLFRYRWCFAALRSAMKELYVLLCIVYTAMFIVAFSSFSNFGLLARERVQLYPLFLVLICIPPPGNRMAPVPEAGPGLEQVAEPESVGA